MRTLWTIWWNIALLYVLSARTFVAGTLYDPIDALKGLISRKFGAQYLSQIELKLLPPTKDGRDVLSVENAVDDSEARIVVGGSSATAMGFALQWYLKQIVHTQTDWDNHQLILPATLPPLFESFRLEKPGKYTYYQNVCTVSYSTWSWNWTQWEQHIDWMALNGINVPLAFTGQEKIWQSVFQNHFNISAAGIQKFFAGSAFLAWGRMGNIRGSWVKGPLPQAFIESQFQLQLNILQRMREYSMTPALPAFAGHIPEEIKTLYPHAKITRSPNWGNFQDQYCCVYMLDPTDALYLSIGSMFIKEQKRMYNYTSSLYQCDTYNEMDPASSDLVYLKSSSNAVLKSMKAADPNAVWLMQGWLFLSSYWTLPRIEAYISHLPYDHFIVLDLYSEVVPIYKKTKNYFNKQWIYCVLHNFGGNMGMRGDLPTLSNDPVLAREQSNNTMVGMGLTMEGIFQNYVVYDLTLEMAWNSRKMDLPKYVKRYTLARYNTQHAHIHHAWFFLLKSVYNVTLGYGGVTKNVITRRPNWHLTKSKFMPSEITYNARHVVGAWYHILRASKLLQSYNDAFSHDIVDITRQVISDGLLYVYKQIRQLYFHHYGNEEDKKKLRHYIHTMKELIVDLDAILSSHQDYLLGHWIYNAKQLATSTNSIESEEVVSLSEYYEYQARNQITRWGDNNGNVLSDYATKQWGSLVKYYYYPRWRVWLNEVYDSYNENRTLNEKEVYGKMEAMELQWQLENISYPIAPVGDPIDIANALYDKYIRGTNHTIYDAKAYNRVYDEMISSIDQF